MQRMYKIHYLPLAKKDIEQITLYIADHLKAPKSAMDLLNSFDKSIVRLKQFPHSCKVYQPIKGLPLEYRMLIVKNYSVFYVVLEDVVEIHRVIYSKRDLSSEVGGM